MIRDCILLQEVQDPSDLFLAYILKPSISPNSSYSDFTKSNSF